MWSVWSTPNFKVSFGFLTRGLVVFVIVSREAYRRKLNRASRIYFSTDKGAFVGAVLEKNLRNIRISICNHRWFGPNFYPQRNLKQFACTKSREKMVTISFLCLSCSLLKVLVYLKFVSIHCRRSARTRSSARRGRAQAAKCMQISFLPCFIFCVRTARTLLRKRIGSKSALHRFSTLARQATPSRPSPLA